MCIGPDEGCHDVPDPIAPIEITFVSLEPTRIPMSSPFMTTSGPISMPGIVCVPSIWPIVPGEGLAMGIGIFVFCSGDGEAAGIGIPGVWRCGWVVVDGDGLGFATGVGLAFGCGI
jgi:hypothetical protein